jgi:hypothetical protein
MINANRIETKRGPIWRGVEFIAQLAMTHSGNYIPADVFFSAVRAGMPSKHQAIGAAVGATMTFSLAACGDGNVAPPANESSEISGQSGGGQLGSEGEHASGSPPYSITGNTVTCTKESGVLNPSTGEPQVTEIIQNGDGTWTIPLGQGLVSYDTPEQLATGLCTITPK